MVRIAVASTILLGIFCAIGAIFWYQEGQYLLPTPLPENYIAVLPKTPVVLDDPLVRSRAAGPALFHFFSPECPCSRFNLKHFLSLNKKYKDAVKFYAVVTDEQKAAAAKDMIDNDIDIIVDKDEKLAMACGVYSTPQAAIVQKDNTLFFRGNYNRARYCTDKNSNYVQMALDSLIAEKDPPHFSSFATNSYGCSLDKQENFPFALKP